MGPGRCISERFSENEAQALQHRKDLLVIDDTCNFNGTFRKPGWRTPTHIAYTVSPVPAAICTSPHPPTDPVLSSVKASFGVSSSIPQLLFCKFKAHLILEMIF